MRSTQPMSRGSLSLLLATALVLILAIAGTSSAYAADCSQPFNCFAGSDGDQISDTAGLTDWQDIAAAVAVAEDPAKGEDTKFAGGDKETEPGSWNFITGNNTPKTDILEGWSQLDGNVLKVAFARVKQNGDTFLAFELNQKAAQPRPGTTGPLYPQRTPGDILFTYDIATTDKLSFGICTWEGTASSGVWKRLDGTVVGGSVKTCTRLPSSGTPPIAKGEVNWNQAIKGYLTAPPYDPIGPGKFGEAVVDFGDNSVVMQRFIAGAMKNACSPNGWFWMHSRASQSVVSQPKDVLTGDPINDPTCDLTIDKKVSLSGAAGTFVDSDANNPLAATVGDTVTYSMTVENTGTADLTIDVSDALCDAGTLSGPGGRDGTGDPLAAGASVTYTCTRRLTATDADPLVNTACTTGAAVSASGASVTIGLAPDTRCDSVVVDVFQPGELASASGSKFLDANSNGAHDGDEGPLAGFVFYVDYNGNSTLDAGEPAAASQAGGTWSISGIRPGAYAVREVADPSYTCTLPANCKYDVTLAGGDSLAVGEFGNAPVPGQLQNPQQQGGQNPGEVIVLGERIAPGRARLLGPTGCAARAFHARIRGTNVARVVFRLDGRRIKTLTRRNLRGSYAVRINPARLSIGVHRLVVRVSFRRGSGTKAKTFRLTFQRCPRALRAPRFTG